MNATQSTLVLMLVLSLATLTGAESSRDRRHRQINERLKETADLQYNYFAPSVHIRYHHPDPQATYLAYYNEISHRPRVFVRRPIDAFYPISAW